VNQTAKTEKGVGLNKTTKGQRTEKKKNCTKKLCTERAFLGSGESRAKTERAYRKQGRREVQKVIKKKAEGPWQKKNDDKKEHPRKENQVKTRGKASKEK